MKRGFSLVETILYIGLSSTIIISVITIITYAYQFKSLTQNSSTVSNDLSYIDQKIQNVIQNSFEVISPVEGSSSQVIELQDSQNSRIFLNQNQIVVEQNGVQSNISPVNYQVQSLQFTNNNSSKGSLVTYKVTIEDSNLKSYQINGSIYQY